MSTKSISSQFVIKNALLVSLLSKRVGNRLSVVDISLSDYLVLHYLENARNYAKVI